MVKNVLTLTANSMPFNERLGVLLQSQVDAKRSNKITNLHRNAKFALPDACIEDRDWSDNRKLDAQLIYELAKVPLLVRYRHRVAVYCPIQKDPTAWNGSRVNEAVAAGQRWRINGSNRTVSALLFGCCCITENS